MTNYTPEHSASDLGGIAIDLVVEGGLFAIGFVTVIGLVVLVVWIKKHLR